LLAGQINSHTPVALLCIIVYICHMKHLSCTRLCLLWLTLPLIFALQSCSEEEEINTNTYFSQRTVWMSSNRSGNFQIWWWRADTMAQVTNEPNLHFWWPQLQPGGEHFICFRGPQMGNHQNTELWRYRKDGTAGDPLVRLSDYNWRSMANVRYSKDGTWMIISAEVLAPGSTSHQWQLFILDSLGNNPRQISNRPHMHFEAAFNPQNDLQIIYNAWPEDEPNGFTFNPRWSLEIHVARLDTPDFLLVEEKRLTTDNFWNAYPTPSWNGQRVAFSLVEDQLNTTIKSNPHSIWTNGTELRQLRRDGTAYACPAWTRDNNYVLFHRTQFGVTSIWMMSSTGQNLTRVVPNDDFDCLHPFVAE